MKTQREEIPYWYYKRCLHWKWLVDTWITDVTGWYFPDADLGEAFNFCRNPDNDPNGPWCYAWIDPDITDSNEYKKYYCKIRHCGKYIFVQAIFSKILETLLGDSLQKSPKCADLFFQKSEKKNWIFLQKIFSSISIYIYVNEFAYRHAVLTLCYRVLAKISKNMWFWRGQIMNLWYAFITHTMIKCLCNLVILSITITLAMIVT